METLNQESEIEKRIAILYPNVKESDAQLPRMWSSKDKFSFLTLSSSNLRVHYKGLYISNLIFNAI